MSSKYFRYQTLLCISLFACANGEMQKGVVCVPITHLVGQPLGGSHMYHELPICGGTLNPYTSCPRMHQLLLHEIVTILKIEGDEMLIDVPHTFFITESTKVPQTRYWTSKKNIMPISELEKNNVDINQIPQPISFQNPSSLTRHEDVVTLVRPFCDPLSKLTYSAGTRFVVSKNKGNKKYIRAYMLDAPTKSMREIKIPRTSLIKSSQETIDEKIQTFVDILRMWAHQEQGFIPYVWGGCSFANLEYSPIIIEHKEERNGVLYSWYTRKKAHPHNSVLHAGFDCAGLINRAAQMAGIPFFFKNTVTIAEHMRELNHKENLEAGDIIWIRGHVMVIANIKNNTIIEARGYDSDFGKVHEIALKKVFVGIQTVADLKRYWLEKQPLIRLNKAGNIQDKFKTFKLLKLRSVFATSLPSA